MKATVRRMVARAGDVLGLLMLYGAVIVLLYVAVLERLLDRI